MHRDGGSEGINRMQPAIKKQSITVFGSPRIRKKCATPLGWELWFNVVDSRGCAPGFDVEPRWGSRGGGWCRWFVPGLAPRVMMDPFDSAPFDSAQGLRQGRLPRWGGTRALSPRRTPSLLRQPPPPKQHSCGGRIVAKLRRLNGVPRHIEDPDASQ